MPHDVALGDVDVDGDGDTEFIASSLDEDLLVVLLNMGDGTI